MPKPEPDIGGYEHLTSVEPTNIDSANPGFTKGHEKLSDTEIADYFAGKLGVTPDQILVTESVVDGKRAVYKKLSVVMEKIY